MRRPAAKSVVVDRPLGAGDALSEVVVRTAAGMALTGFGTFALALAHLLSPVGAVVWLALLAAAFAYRGDAPWAPQFWRTRFGLWRRAITPGAILVYLAALPLGFMAAWPDLGSDATTNYMVYATEWAHAHSLVVDPFVRAAYAPDNWVLLDAWLVTAGRSDAASMLTWLAGCLSLLGVFAYVQSVGEREGTAAPRPVVVIGLLAVASLVFSPLFMSNVGLSLVDVPIGLMFLASCLSLVRGVRTRGEAGVAELVVCAAFFVGMKVSLVVFMPLFGAAVLFVVARSGAAPRRALTVVAVFAALSLPWYVKDFVQAGDPLTPILNLAIRGADPKWSKSDLALAQDDLKSHEGGALARAAIPLDIVLHPTEFQFRAPGVSFMMLGLVLPGSAVAYVLFRRSSRARVETLAFGASVLFAVGYWISTSYMARYSLEFDAALAAFCGGLLAAAAFRGRYARWAALACAAVFALPSPGATSYYHQLKAANADFYDNYVDTESWLVPRGPLYPEVQYISERLHRAHREDLRVYRPNIETDRLYWAQQGVTAAGDLIGPDRYAGFYRAIFDDELRAYVKRFNIGAFVMVNGNPAMPPALLRRFQEEAHALGIRSVSLPGRPVVMYLSSDIPG